MAVGEDVVGADGLTNRERFEMRRERKRQQAEERAARAAASREAAIARARAEAEAAVASAASQGGMLSGQQPATSGGGLTFGGGSSAPAPAPEPTPEPTPEPEMTYDERRYQELLGRGVIDEQGNILKPGGINPTEIMRGEAPSWATPELVKNAYIQAFESKNRAGQNFMDSGDYQNFLDAGYSLSQDQVDALGGVQGQGNQNDLTFGGGQPTTGVASSAAPNPAPSAPSPAPPAPSPAPPAPGSLAAQEMLGYDFKERDAYKAGSATPFMDAYLRSREAATKEGPVSSLFKDMLKGS